MIVDKSLTLTALGEDYRSSWMSKTFACLKGHRKRQETDTGADAGLGKGVSGLPTTLSTFWGTVFPSQVPEVVLEGLPSLKGEITAQALQSSHRPYSIPHPTPRGPPAPRCWGGVLLTWHKAVSKELLSDAWPPGQFL